MRRCSPRGCRPAGARAVVARGRAGVVAFRCRDGRSTSRPISTRDGRNRRAGEHRRLEQRPRVAARPRQNADAACGAGSSPSRSRRMRAINRRSPAGGGAERNAVPSYDFPALAHREPPPARPCRSAPRRCATLGAFANVFAIESFMDELARRAGEDPLTFRLRHLKDPRGVAPCSRARAAGGRLGALARREGDGRASALRATRTAAPGAPSSPRSRRCRAVRVRRLVVPWTWARSSIRTASDNQIEGGAIQATSWCSRKRCASTARA